jgi:hypothetical protein
MDDNDHSDHPEPPPVDPRGPTQLQAPAQPLPPAQPQAPAQPPAPGQQQMPAQPQAPAQQQVPAQPQAPAQPQPQIQQPQVVHVQAMYQPKIGDVINKSFSVFGRHFLGIMLTSIIVFLPFIWYAFSTVDGNITEESLEDFQGSLTLGAMALTWLLTSIITWGTVQELEGKTIEYSTTVKEGLKALPQAFGTGLVVGLGILGSFLLLIVPGFIVTCMWYVAIPAAVCERAGVGASITRSTNLTKGWRWQILGVILLMFLIFVFAAGMITALAGKGLQEQAFASLISQILFAAFGAIVPAVVFHELRQARGGTMDDLADVFD